MGKAFGSNGKSGGITNSRKTMAYGRPSYTSGAWYGFAKNRRHLKKGYYNKMLFGSRRRASGTAGTRRRGGTVINQYVLRPTGGGELKSKVVRLTAPVNMSATVPVEFLNASLPIMDIINGTTDHTRIGQVIYVKSLAIRMSFIHENSGVADAGIPHEIRVSLVYDRSNNSAATAPAADVIWNGNTADTVRNFKTIQEGKRFIVLKEKTIMFNPNTGSVNVAGTAMEYAFPLKSCDFYYKAGKDKGLPIHYTAGTGVATERTRGNFILYVASSSQTIRMNNAVILMRWTDS